MAYIDDAPTNVNISLNILTELSTDIATLQSLTKSGFEQVNSRIDAIHSNCVIASEHKRLTELKLTETRTDVKRIKSDVMANSDNIKDNSDLIMENKIHSTKHNTILIGFSAIIATAINYLITVIKFK